MLGSPAPGCLANGPERVQALGALEALRFSPWLFVLLWQARGQRKQAIRPRSGSERRRGGQAHSRGWGTYGHPQRRLSRRPGNQGTRAKLARRARWQVTTRKTQHKSTKVGSRPLGVLGSPALAVWPWPRSGHSGERSGDGQRQLVSLLGSL